jgi:hypothetical protein
VVAMSPAAARDSLDDVLAWIEMPPEGAGPAAERQRRAERLSAVVGCDRDHLERVRSTFLRRLYQASDDFGATAGLRVVEAALCLIPWPEGEPGLPPQNKETR